MKKVTFNENKNTIRRTFTWSFAHRQARQSNFQQLILDRCRFQRRIGEMKMILDGILERDYRNKIYEERFVDI